VSEERILAAIDEENVEAVNDSLVHASPPPLSSQQDKFAGEQRNPSEVLEDDESLR